MRLHISPGYAAAKAAHTEAYRALYGYLDATGDDDKSPEYARLNKAEDEALTAWMTYPASTPKELADKLAYAEGREMLYWTGWEKERAGIMHDFEVLARHPVSLRSEYEAWRSTTEAHMLCDQYEDVTADALCAASSDATRALVVAPCITPADFMLKTYANLHGECGSTWHGPASEDGTGNLWDLDLKSFQDERNLNDAWVRSAYADLDGSDLGACLLSFGRIDFDASAWLDRASRIGQFAMLVEQEDGTRGLYLCEDAEYRQPDERIGIERNRLRRLAAYDSCRVRLICEEIERAWPHLIARRAA